MIINDNKPIIYVLRHGATEWNKTGQLTSHTDIPLSKDGMKQADEAGRGIKRVSIDRIITSPLSRAKTTAEIIAQYQKNLIEPIHVDKRMLEVNFGKFEGKTGKEILESELADLYLTWQNGEDISDSISCEKWESVRERANSLFIETSAKLGTTLLVGHGYFLRLLISSCVLGLPYSKIRRLRFDNCRFAAILWEGNIPRLIAFNTVNLNNVVDDSPTS